MSMSYMVREVEVIRCYKDGHWDRIRARIPLFAVANDWRDNAPNVMHWIVISDNTFDVECRSTP